MGVKLPDNNGSLPHEWSVQIDVTAPSSAGSLNRDGSGGEVQVNPPSFFMSLGWIIGLGIQPGLLQGLNDLRTLKQFLCGRRLKGRLRSCHHSPNSFTRTTSAQAEVSACLVRVLYPRALPFSSPLECQNSLAQPFPWRGGSGALNWVSVADRLLPFASVSEPAETSALATLWMSLGIAGDRFRTKRGP
jgi:hypothetical protein